MHRPRASRTGNHLTHDRIGIVPLAPHPSPRRTIGQVVIVVLLAFLCLNAWIQAVLKLMGNSSDPALLTAWQLLSGGAAGAATVGAWQRRRWAPAAALAYGVITGAMIVALGPMLDLAEDERGGLLVGGFAVLCVGALMAWYVRRVVTRTG